MNPIKSIKGMFKKDGPVQPIARPDDPRFWTYWSLDGVSTDQQSGIPQINEAGKQLKGLRGWVFALCNRISNDLISFERVLQKQNSDGTWDEATDYKAKEFLKILDNPFQYGSAEDYFKVQSLALNLTGRANAHIKTIGTAGVVLDKLVPISPEHINYHVDDFGMLDYWDFRARHNIRLSPDKILYTHYQSPNDIYTPLSPVKAVSDGINLYHEALNYNYKWVKNDTQASAYGSPRVGYDFDQKAIDKLKAWARAQVGRIGNFEILPVGMDIVAKANGSRQMQFGGDLEKLAQEMANAYGYMLFLLTGAGINRSVMEVGLYITRESCIRPHAKIIEAAFNKQVVQRFLGPDYWYSFVIPELKFSDDTAKMLQNDLQYNIRSREEIREERGLDPEFTGTEPNPKVQVSFQQPTVEPEPPVQPTKTIKLIQPKPLKLKSSFKSEDRFFEWKSFDTLATAVQSPFAGDLLRSFKRQGKQYVQRVKAAYESGEPITAEMFDREFAHSDVKKISTPHIKNGASRGYQNGKRQARSRGEYEENALREAYLGLRIDKMADVTTHTTYQKIAALVAKGTPSKKTEKANSVMITLEDFIKEVDDMFGGFDFRAALGAETQTIGVLNWGMQEGYKDSDVSGKEWLSQQDDRVRGPNSTPPSEYNHEIDGEIVPLNGKFNTGAEMIDYPGDPTASPGNICNCRCAMLPTF
jgi:hypothetical protein